MILLTAHVKPKNSRARALLSSLRLAGTAPTSDPLHDCVVNEAACKKALEASGFRPGFYAGTWVRGPLMLAVNSTVSVLSYKNVGLALPDDIEADDWEPGAYCASLRATEPQVEHALQVQGWQRSVTGSFTNRISGHRAYLAVHGLTSRITSVSLKVKDDEQYSPV